MIRIDIDELDIPDEYDGQIDDLEAYLDEYYSSMPVSDEQKEKRKKAARDLRDALIFLFLLMRTSIESGYWEYDFLLLQFRTEFRGAVEKYARVDPYVENYIQTFTEEFLDTTIEHLGKSDAAFFLSDDRATIAGVNESNSVLNYEELQEAIDAGYTHKVWQSQRDNRVRHTHVIADGQKVEIDKYFIVGGVALMMPHDPECTEMQEISNCRCACRYL